ncbi:hypothetical protein CsatB_030391 [Cannabis sativa]
MAHNGLLVPAEARISPQSHWTVFDGTVKAFPLSPDALMVDINSAISNLEFSRATALLESRSPPPPSSSSSPSKKKSFDSSKVAQNYDARMADEAFTAGCTAFNAGKHDEALRCLNLSLSKCPPECCIYFSAHKANTKFYVSTFSSLNKMTVLCHEEHSNPSKGCKFLAACLKEAFSNCHNFRGRISTLGQDEEYPTSDFDDEEEEVVSAIRSGALEKLKKKPILMSSDNFSWVYYSPITRQLYISSKGLEQKEDDSNEDYEKEEFLSVKSCFSCCSSVAASKDVFLSVNTSFSHCPSPIELDLKEYQRRSIIQEFCHCEGWPFGLCRKVVLLPPLPKSPSESWSWHKGTTKMVKLTY